ncbi:MAG: cupin domain-containing protein [Actinomycetes bacterium]
MPHTIVHASDIEPLHGVFRPLRGALGVTAFGINELELGPDAEGPEHDHAGDGQEEVYVIIRGSGTIRVDGEDHELKPGAYVALTPDTRRKMIAGPDGLAWIGVGCKPGSYTSER